MFYLTIPLIIIVIALLGVVVVVWRKMPFLRKLTPNSHEMGDTWMHDMAPEAVDWFRSIPLKRYQHSALLEFEKLLRRFRLMFSTVDRLSERLVHKVRRGHQQAAKDVAVHEVQQMQAAKELERDPDEVDMDDAEQLRQEEQRLIVAIAQSPKDAELYSDLARVYMKMRNYADAVEALKTCVKLAPEDAAYAKRLESAQKRLAQTATV